MRRAGSARRGLRGFGGAVGVTPALSLEAQIIAQFTAASWTVHGLFLARAADVTLVSTKVSVWANLGSGGDAVQATDSLRPEWNATGINSRPSLDFALDRLVTPSIDLTSSSAMAVTVLFSDLETNVRWLASLGTAWPPNSGIELLINNAGAGRLEGFASDGTLNTRARAAASYPMTTASTVTATWDWDLSTQQMTIRHDAADVTDSGSTVDTAGPAARVFTIGAGEGGYGPLHAGKIAACVIAAGSSAIPTTQLAAVETLLIDEWGL